MSKKQKHRKTNRQSEKQQSSPSEFDQPTVSDQNSNLDESSSTIASNSTETDQPPTTPDSTDSDRPIEQILEEQNDENPIDDEAIDKQTINEQPVIVKKGSSMLGLLLSLLAICGCGYLYYLQYIVPQEDPQQITAILKQQNQNLQQQLQQLQTQSSTELNKLQQQLQQQSQAIARLQQATAAQPPTEQLLDRFVEQTELTTIQQQLTEQQQKIAQLQTTAAQPNNPQQATAQADMQQRQQIDQLLNRNQIINRLYLSKNLLQSKDFTAAKQQLQQAIQQMPPKLKTEAEQLLKAWQSIQQPNLKPIQKQLNQAKKMASQLGLQVEQQTDEATSKEAWYNRFISIKKIDQKNNLENSNQLQLLKIQITQKLLQAEWSLNLQQQSNWQKQLNHAANLLLKKMPYEQQLQQQLRNLAKQQIATKPLPSQPLEKIIEQLKSVTP